MITVLIPFFDQNNYRRRNLTAVVDNYRKNFPTFKVIVAEQSSSSTFVRDLLLDYPDTFRNVLINVDSERFNKCQVLNTTIREHIDSDIIMMSDADCILPPLSVEFFEEGLSKGSIFFPFSRVNFLNEGHTRRLVGGKQLIQGVPKQDLFINRYTGLVNVFTRDTFEAVGGFDSEFEGWGGEDDAFVDKCNRLISPIHRIQSDIELIHLYHPKNNTLEYINSECFTWNKKRVATIKRMSDDELREYVANVKEGINSPLQPIVEAYDEQGKLGFSYEMSIGSGTVNIDTTVYDVVPVDGKISLREILQAVYDVDGVAFLSHIIDLIDERIVDMSDDETEIVDYFRALCS